MGRYVRADHVIAVVPVEGDHRGPGRRTLVWLEGLAEPVIASRGEQGIMADLVSGAVVSVGDGLDGAEEATDPPPYVEPPPSLF